MNVLAFDTSTPSTAVGLSLGAGAVLDAYDHPAPRGRPGHQARLLPLAAQLLDRAGIDWSRLDRVGVGVGPGTYTGLRVGVATARGLAQSLAIEIVGISSSMALAHTALRSRHAGPVMTVVDARRGELFLAAYAPASSGPPALLSAPRPVAADALREAVDEIVGRESGRDDDPWLAVGDAVRSVSTTLTAAGLNVPAEDPPLQCPSGVALCELATLLDAQPIDVLLPDYCRPADAEIALTQRGRARSNGHTQAAPKGPIATSQQPARLAGKAPA
jgi:tRNA threonylcarbamoyladenosine biosynthesis protein TsaB